MAQTIPTNCGMCQLARLMSDIVTHSLELSPPLTSISLAKADDIEGGTVKVCSAVLERHACTVAVRQDVMTPIARTQEWHMSSTPVAKAIARLWKHIIQTTLALYGCPCIMKEHPSEVTEMFFGSAMPSIRKGVLLVGSSSPVEFEGI